MGEEEQAQEEEVDANTIGIDIAIGNQKHRIMLTADSDPYKVAADF